MLQSLRKSSFLQKKISEKEVINAERMLKNSRAVGIDSINCRNVEIWVWFVYRVAVTESEVGDWKSTIVALLYSYNL